MNRPTTAIWTGVAVFAAALAYLLASSLAPRRAATFDPTPPNSFEPPTGWGAVDTVTIDASDQSRWVYLDLNRGVLMPPDTIDWQLAFRRFNLRARRGLWVLDDRSLSTILDEPDARYDSTRALQSSVKWYDYNLITHLLEPRNTIYILGPDADTFGFEVLSYYCEGMRPGCVTLRYSRLPAADSTP